MSTSVNQWTTKYILENPINKGNIMATVIIPHFVMKDVNTPQKVELI
jgi:hypothetical protein